MKIIKSKEGSLELTGTQLFWLIVAGIILLIFLVLFAKAGFSMKTMLSGFIMTGW